MIINTNQGGVVPDQIIDAATITPGVADQVLEVATYLRGAQTILGDADLIPENIKEGVNIFNITGNCAPPYGLYGWSKGEYRDAHDISSNRVGRYASYSSGVSITIEYSQSITVTENEIILNNPTTIEIRYGTVFSMENTYIKITAATGGNIGGSARLAVVGDIYYGDNIQAISEKNSSENYLIYFYTAYLCSPGFTTMGYAVSNDMDEYPADGLYSDGYYYKILDIPAIQAAAYNLALQDMGGSI